MLPAEDDGEGAEGGCGTEEKPCPVSRASSNAAASTATRVGGVNVYVQARKALCEHSPFDEPEELARVSTLPVGLATSLFKSSDGRRKHKKLHSDSVKKVPSAQQAPEVWSLWTETEEYFRPITLADVDKLAVNWQFGGSSPHSCFTMPISRSLPKQELQRAIIAPAPVCAANGAETAAVVREKLDADYQEEPQRVQETMVNMVKIESTAGSVSAQKDGDLGVDTSINWILGSKHRTLLASEGRPNKKRKLIGGDSGLRRLLLLPNAQAEDLRICDYCCLGDNSDGLNRLLQCNSCKVSVHMKCYGVRDAPQGTWLCSWCRQSEATNNENKDGDGPCLLCPKRGGALKMVGTNIDQSGRTLKFAHLFCSLWMPEVTIGNIETMEPIMNTEGVHETRKRPICSICKVKQGACIRCSHGACRTSFHPVCARDAKLRMEIWGKGCDDVELLVFCARHSSLHDGFAVQNSENLSGTDLDCSLASNLLSVPSMNKVQKIRITCKDRDKSSGRENSSFQSVTDNEVASEQDSTIRVKSNSSNSSLSEMTLTNEQSCDMDNGVADVALEMGIPFDSLDSVLAMFISQFFYSLSAGSNFFYSSELKLKVVRWFQDYVHLGGPLRHLNSANGGRLSSSATEERDCGPETAKVGDSGALGSVLVNSMPHWDTFINESCNVKMFNAATSIDKEDAGDAAYCAPPFHETDYSSKVREILKKLNVFIINIVICKLNFSVILRFAHGEYIYLLIFVLQMEEGASWCSEVNSSEIFCCRSAKIHKCVISSILLSKKCHLFVLAMQAHRSNQNARFLQLLLVLLPQSRDEVTSFMETDLSMKNCSNQQSTHSVCASHSPLNDANFDPLARARGVDIIGFSPEDEVEGEILYLQNKLLNTVVVIKQRCEKLMHRVLRRLPEELDSLKKRRWDLVAVNQYLRHLKEAKKRGRKEKRHKEYQAALAAAAAAAIETSSRVSSHRKETNDVLLSSQEDGTPASQVKEIHLKLATPKVALEKQSDINEELCDICGRAETMLSRIFICGGCKVAVHLDCYRRPRSPISSWSCEVCEESCVLSAVYAVVLLVLLEKLQMGNGFTTSWVLETTFRRGQENHVEGMEVALRDKELLSCGICHQKIGVCIKCSHGDCHVAFHPFCAKRVGLLVSVRNINGKVHHKAYCEKHGTEQRLKADIQQYSTEELRSIKQIRVELEKVRLLCERIIRREKLKRDLVLCSHDILAARRDYVAFSLLVDSSSFVPGVSSESATTSINNRSYSDTLQRSDDVTVDSSVSVKRKARLPVKQDLDGKTDGSHTSQLASARKGRPAPVSSHSSVAREKRLKPRKHMEIFQKEVVMTSDQASIQNKRLPKGFVYVPVDSLPNSHGVETLEPRRPDG
ncbi:unnamed protein product [Spirodela intermedia]|uniref:Uncharacterized protein n=1 Tax=Spirodela intermedia TaxID=51605 RepID=A0A7I8IPC3_SPIIN|nr:unnamed protein product [Spirodela intermedia]CAA6659414.1 unnamed protein product [Spirodela intermedia]